MFKKGKGFGLLGSAPIEVNEFVPANTPPIQKSNPTVQGARVMSTGERIGGWMNAPLYEGAKSSRADALYTLGAGLKDMSSNSRGGNLDAARDMFAQREAQGKAEKERQARAKAAAAAMQGGSFNPQAYVAQLAEMGLPAGLEDFAAAEQLGRAQQPQYEYFNSEDGDRYRYDPKAGKAELIYDYTDPYADLERQEREARIASIKALGSQRDSQGDYYAARAAQPYAPQRPRVSGGSGGAGAVRVASPQQLAALPSGSLFVGPDGVTRRKP